MIWQINISFSVDCIFIDNDIRHHSGQNVVDSRGAALWIHNKKLVRFITFWIDHKLKKNLRHFEICLIHFIHSIQLRKLLMVSFPCADVPLGENQLCNNFKRPLT